MKLRRNLLGISLMLISSICYAEDYFGFKVGKMTIEDNYFDRFNLSFVTVLDTSTSDPTNIGIFYGSSHESGVGFEVEANFTSSDGSVQRTRKYNDEDDLGSDIHQTGGNFSTETISGYITYRSPSSIYLKGKLGASSIKLEGRGIPYNEVESSLSYGLGVGFGSGIKYEIEFISIEENINFISFGVVF